jgi:RNA polymerase sigma-70 factor (ECF subfamily)
MNDNASAVTEHLLLRQAKTGNSDAFSELVRLNFSSVYGISLKILKNREDAEDNLQNVFCKAFRKIRDFRGESRVSTWLFRIAVNEALMQLRRNLDKEIHYSDTAKPEEDNRPLLEAEDSRPNPEARCINADLAEKAFRGCAPLLANIFVLNKTEGWTNRELAKAYGTSVQTVKSRVFRTRIRLQRHIAELATMKRSRS